MGGGVECLRVVYVRGGFVDCVVVVAWWHFFCSLLRFGFLGLCDGHLLALGGGGAKNCGLAVGAASFFFFAPPMSKLGAVGRREVCAGGGMHVYVQRSRKIQQWGKR